MESIKEAFGKNLRKIRKDRGMSQRELAVDAGINFRQLSKIENGNHFPSYKTLENLCDSLNMTPYDFFINRNCHAHKNEAIVFDKTNSDEHLSENQESPKLEDDVRFKLNLIKNGVFGQSGAAKRPFNPKLKKLLEECAHDDKRVRFVEKLLCSLKCEDSFMELIECIEEMLEASNLGHCSQD